MGWTVVVVCRNNGNFMDFFACMFPDCIENFFFIFTIQVKTSGKENLAIMVLAMLLFLNKESQLQHRKNTLLKTFKM